MRKARSVIVALVLAIVMAMPLTVMASTYAEPQMRVEDEVVFVPLRYVAESLDATVEWDGTNRTAVITRLDGEVFIVPVENIGGFIENGVSWVTFDFAMHVLFEFLTDVTATEYVEPVERIDLDLWDAGNFEDVREPMFSTDLPPGAIAVGYIEYMSDNLGARSAFTYRELEAAVWIVEELLAMGHGWDSITIQEFTYWDVNDLELGLFGTLDWDLVTHPMVLGEGREYQLRADRVSQNIILTLPGQSERKIVVGAHYDSPPYASASDNASGTALLMESAQRMLEQDHYYTIVYVFFGAEEVGLIGAYYYYELLTTRQRNNIVMMVNADVIIEGPYLFYGAAALPTLDDAFLDELREDLLYAAMDIFIMQYEMIMAEVEEMGVDPSLVLPFDSLEGYLELVVADIAALPIPILLMQASMLGVGEPEVTGIAQQVSNIATELASLHDFEFVSAPELVTFPTDSLVFLFAGHTIVNFVGMERVENVSPELEAQLTRFGEGWEDFSVTILHTPLDNFQFIEATWPGMMNANLEAFVIFLQEILTGRFS